jgi:hypothetical protein
LPAVVIQLAVSTTDNMFVLPTKPGENKLFLKLILLPPNKLTILPTTDTDVNGVPLVGNWK